MTPELLARFRSDDDRVADAATEEWDRACAAYRDHLALILPDLPPAAHWLSSPTLCLHDARVVSFQVGEGRPVALAVVEPDHPRGKTFGLQYFLVPPFIEEQHHPALSGDGPPGRFWLYDEFEVITDEPYPTLRHSILLTGGLEVRLYFNTLDGFQVRKLLPVEGVARPGEVLLTGGSQPLSPSA